MTGKPPQTTNEPEPPRSKRGGSRSDASAVAQGLDQFRDAILARLAEIESMALDLTALLGGDSSEKEIALRERIAALEAASARLQAESKRKEQEWQAILKKLDQDRVLLAEAWDRLEQQQVEAPVPQVATSPTTVTAARRAPTDEGDDPVTRAVLWQFQALKSDVRRNAKGRNGR
jgi:hypothetical protein